MNGRTLLRVVAVLALVAVAVGIGAAAYNAGVTAGLSEAAQQAVASGEPAPGGPYGFGYGPYLHGPWGAGFGFFGIFFWILGIILIIGLLRFAFGAGRWGGRGPGGGWGGRREMAEEWHRELHRRDGDGGEPAGA